MRNLSKLTRMHMLLSQMLVSRSKVSSWKNPPLIFKVCRASLTKFGILMMSTGAVPSIRRRRRSSSKTLLETSDLETSSPKRPSMRFSPPSIRMGPVPSRSQKWSTLSSYFWKVTLGAQ